MESLAAEAHQRWASSIMTSTQNLNWCNSRLCGSLYYCDSSCEVRRTVSTGLCTGTVGTRRIVLSPRSGPSQIESWLGPVKEKTVEPRTSEIIRYYTLTHSWWFFIDTMEKSIKGAQVQIRLVLSHEAHSCCTDASIACFSR